MRFTFKPDECMVITIPLRSVRNAGEGQLMPDKFTCRFKDSYKVFKQGRPKALGAAQIITAVFILCLGGLLVHWEITEHGPKIYVFHTSGLIGLISSILYIICGTLAIGAGHTPVMPVMKASFIFNIICLCLAVVMIVICGLNASLGPRYGQYYQTDNVYVGLAVVIMLLYVFEFVISAILIHWESKAVCRAHFNSLPMITLKHDM